jgi:uncharacterized coiled-coil DUF342 family protein
MMRSALRCLIGPIVVAMAGCATSGPTLSSSVERLEDSSFALERHAEQRNVRADARELSEEARDFRRTLIHYRADKLDVHEAFSDLSRNYHDLRDEVERSRDRETERYFEPVTNAYLDIEREIDRSGQLARDDG